MHDWMLALIVLLLVRIDVLILAIFMATEGVNGRLGAVTVQDRENPVSTEGVSVTIILLTSEQILSS